MSNWRVMWWIYGGYIAAIWWTDLRRMRGGSVIGGRVVDWRGETYILEARMPSTTITPIKSLW
jgi:hypothetical protein